MKRILVTAAGGAPAINFTRSLRDSKDKFFLLGVDSSEYTIHRSETDEIEICPKASDPDYINYLNFLIEKYDIEFLHAQPDAEVGVISDNREKLKCKTFLPDKKSVAILRDKYLSYQEWQKHGCPVPETIMLNNEDDLKRSFEKFGKDIWVREIQGAAGKGSLSSPTYEEAFKQIDRVNGWGRYTAADKLKPNSVTWMAIYNKGKLVVAQTRERLYWEASNRAQSGVTGITGTGRTTSSKLLNDISMQAVSAIDKEPHGIWSVDMTYDRNNHPNLTEINIGKFFTTHYFFTKAGINFPEIYVKLAFGEEVNIKQPMNPLPDGLNWIRGMDMEPVLIEDKKISDLLDKYKKQKSALTR